MITFLTATNPRRTDFGIRLDVEIEGRGVCSFLASPDDIEAHGRDLHARALAGEFGPILDEAPSEPPSEEP